MSTYDILQDTLCLYCQKTFASPGRLQRHVLTKHPGTYAANAIEEARQEALDDAAAEDVIEDDGADLDMLDAAMGEEDSAILEQYR